MAELMTIAELETRMGRTFTGAELAQMEASLSDLTDEIVFRLRPYLDSNTAPTTNGGIKRVMTNILSRSAANPNGLTGENLGDYGWQAAGGSANWYVSADEWRRLRRLAGLPYAGNVDMVTYSGVEIYDEREV